MQTLLGVAEVRRAKFVTYNGKAIYCGRKGCKSLGIWHPVIVMHDPGVGWMRCTLETRVCEAHKVDGDDDPILADLARHRLSVSAAAVGMNPGDGTNWTLEWEK